MTNMTKDMQKALVRADRAGLVTVSATPEWWREWGLSTEWPGYVEVIAQAGEEARNSDVCGVIGRTTSRPCRHNTALHGPCPNHCETPLPIHCATTTKTGGWCRWNLAARGECPNHSDSYDRYMAAVRADEEEELCRQAVRELEARKAAKALGEAVLGVECPHCDAQPGGDCKTVSGELQPRLHGAREKRWRHRDAASRASCPVLRRGHRRPVPNRDRQHRHQPPLRPRLTTRERKGTRPMKPRLTYDEHVEMGRALASMRADLLHRSIRLANAYPQSGPMAAPAKKLDVALRAVDAARDELENALYREHAEVAQTTVYYPLLEDRDRVLPSP